ncbi:MAG: flagellar motor switch protein FliG [Phycisphaerales bacterium JB043]
MKPGMPIPESAADLPGLTKAAVLLLSLDPINSAEVLKQLNSEQIEDVTREVASLQRVPEHIRQQVLDEFYSLSLAHQGVREGGLEYAKVLLSQSMDTKDAERLLGKIQTQVQKTPFAFLQKAESENLLTFIQDEHPQTIALILCHMPHYKSSEILVGLPGQKQVEVIKRIANMEQTNPEVIREVEKGLESRLANMLMQSTEKAGGIETVSEMLNLADRATEKTIMEALEQEDPDLVEEIRRLMFVFEDILLVNDKGIQAVLKEVDNDELSLALKTASEELKEKVFGNMSARAAEMIKEDMEYMGPVRISDVENSQQRIVDIVRRLEDAGEIMISGRGGESEMIV